MPRSLEIFWVLRQSGVGALLAPLLPRRYGWLLRLWSRQVEASQRGASLRFACERLGPIFIKLGQTLSTRADLVPPDILNQLRLLQDQVPPFESALAVKEIERSLGQPLTQLFATFTHEAHAAASVAQVHFATMHSGQEVAVKILRPAIAGVIARDLKLMYFWARRLQQHSSTLQRLRLIEVIAEFDKHLQQELDLMYEAAHASQLRHNFKDSPLLQVPEVFWSHCAKNVMTMSRMYGVPVSDMQRLTAAGIDPSELGARGVEIFFTQVFRHGFFHADMHPGNILVSVTAPTTGQYIALDFGIMGTLNDVDRDYLARNFLAFFDRDYRQVAKIHLESGWVPETVREDELESAIRACCEPNFDKSLKDISYGQVLLRLFQVSRQFNIKVQPQLVMLQKTLMNVEGLGRSLDPDLNLWDTAKPILQRWMQEQVGWRAWVRHLKIEGPYLAKHISQLPRLLNQSLTTSDARELQQLVVAQQKTQQQLLRLNILLAGVLLGVVMVVLLQAL